MSSTEAHRVWPRADAPTWMTLRSNRCMQGETAAPLQGAPSLLSSVVKCTLTLHSTVEWQKGREIKVQLQSKQSITLFSLSNFSPFSRSAACEIGPTSFWMREEEEEEEKKVFLASRLFDESSAFCLLLRRCPPFGTLKLIAWFRHFFYSVPISHTFCSGRFIITASAFTIWFCPRKNCKKCPWEMKLEGRGKILPSDFSLYSK